MNKETLQQLGLNEEQIKGVFAENGKDIKAEQKKAKAELEKVTSERDTYKKDLDSAKETLKGFDGVNVEELKGNVANLTKQLEDKQKEYESNIAQRDFTDKLSNKIKELGGKNVKAISALLDIEALRSSKNQDTDIATAIDAIKKENDYMFGGKEPIDNPVGGTNNGGGSGSSTDDEEASKLRKIMGLPPLKNEK